MHCFTSSGKLSTYCRTSECATDFDIPLLWKALSTLLPLQTLRMSSLLFNEFLRLHGARFPSSHSFFEFNANFFTVCIKDALSNKSSASTTIGLGVMFSLTKLYRSRNWWSLRSPFWCTLDQASGLEKLRTMMLQLLLGYVLEKCGQSLSCRLLANFPRKALRKNKVLAWVCA